MMRIPVLALGAMLLASCAQPLSKEGKEAVDYQMPEPSATWIVSSSGVLGDCKTTAPSNEIDIVMAKGEWEHIQVLITPDETARYTISRLGNESVIDFQCRTLTTFDGMEDILVPSGEVVSPKNGNIKVWLSFFAHLDAKPGTYSEVVEFRTDSLCYPVKANITIGDVAVPEIPSIPAVFGITFDKIVFPARDEESKAEARKQVSDLLLGYRIAPYFCEWVGGSMTLETNSSPYGPTDDRMWEYLKDPRFTAIALPSTYLKEDELSAMLERARQEGLLDKAYFYLWDEPTTTEQYGKIRAKADLIHKYAPEAKVLTTFYCGPTDGAHAGDLFGTWEELRGATSIFCTGVWSLQGNENRSAQAAASCKDGEQWWTYTCMGDVPGLAWNSAGIANRAVLWRSWKEGPKGYLFWSVNAFQGVNPLTVRKDIPKGDAVLVLPGQHFGCEGLCVSARLERWRDSAEDYELLLQYEQKLGRDAALTLLGNVYKSPADFTDNTKYVDAFHKHLIQDVL